MVRRRRARAWRWRRHWRRGRPRWRSKRRGQPPALEAALEVEPDARLVAALEAVRADPYLDDPCLNDSRLTVLGAALERERAARAKFWPVRLLELEMDTALAQERAALEEAEAKALEAAAGLTGIGVRLRSAIPAG